MIKETGMNENETEEGTESDEEKLQGEDLK